MRNIPAHKKDRPFEFRISDFAVPEFQPPSAIRPALHGVQGSPEPCVVQEAFRNSIGGGFKSFDLGKSFCYDSVNFSVGQFPNRIRKLIFD
jgi:hypothetical protein